MITETQQEVACKSQVGGDRDDRREQGDINFVKLYKKGSVSRRC